MKGREQLCNNFVDILKNEDIQQSGGEAFGDFIQALFSGDAFAGLSSIKILRILSFTLQQFFFGAK
ncbi:MAG: hypothetical protein HDT43_10280 [Ruminococcaceae bacterium]|nr:hypothetical protein [Oscillospiraceae bacterium]